VGDNEVDGGLAMLTAEEIDRFHEEGYLAIARPVLTPAQLQRLRSLIEPLFTNLDRVPDNWVHDLGEPAAEGTSIPEVVFTAEIEPRIRMTAAYRTMRSIAAQLLGAPATINFDHAIVKPARTVSFTPWHQDFAFNLEDRSRTVNFWIPLADATRENGCMRFIPGSHLEPTLPHVTQGSDALHAVGAPEERMVVRPVPAGGFTVHTQRTLHSSGPNATDTDRLAWVVKYQPDERSTGERLSERMRIATRVARRSLLSRRPQGPVPDATPR
jgi:Phytanoyl-CoA dioxygenase (PhyH)